MDFQIYYILYSFFFMYTFDVGPVFRRFRLEILLASKEARDLVGFTRVRQGNLG